MIFFGRFLPPPEAHCGAILVFQNPVKIPGPFNGWYSYLHEWLNFMVNVGKYTKCLGMVVKQSNDLKKNTSKFWSVSFSVH